MFAKEGVEVELINMAIHEAMFAGLFAGQVDVIDATVDDMLPNFDPEQPFVCVLTLTDSLGADGIVASNDIQIDRRPQGQDGGVRRAYGLAVLSERAAQGGRPQPGGHRGRGT